MNAITSKYGPSPKAFLVIPLIGAFFIDIVNALVIKFFANLPVISQTGVTVLKKRRYKPNLIGVKFTHPPHCRGLT